MNKEINTKNKERYYFLDLLKSIAIFLVVIYHIGTFLDGNILSENVTFIDYIKYYLRSFMAMGVPIFFFVNGALMFNKEFNLKKHLIKIVKLICITIFWTIFSFIAMNSIMDGKVNIVEAIKSIWSLKVNYNHYLWFLYTLVILYIFFPILKVTWDNNKKIFYVFLLVVFIVTVGNKLLVQAYNLIAMILRKGVKDINTYIIPYSFNPVAGIYGYSLVYFMLGAICFKSKDKLKKKKYTIIASICIIISSVLLCLYWTLIEKYTNQNIDYVWNSYYIIFTLINVLSLFVICIQYKENKIINKVIKTIGSNTLGIYLMHMIIINILRYSIGINLRENTIIELIWSVIIIMVSLMISVIVKKIPIIKNSLLS